MVTSHETVQQPTLAEYDTADITCTKLWRMVYFTNPYRKELANKHTEQIGHFRCLILGFAAADYLCNNLE
jgi:hypothetical protein